MKVLIVDDHPLIRAALQTALRADPAFEVVGEADTGLHGLRQAKKLKPDVVITDIHMRPMDGIRMTRLLLEQQPEVIVIGFSFTYSDYQAEMLLQAGAAACIRKDAPLQEVKEVILSKWQASIAGHE